MNYSKMSNVELAEYYALHFDQKALNELGRRDKMSKMTFEEFLEFIELEKEQNDA